MTKTRDLADILSAATASAASVPYANTTSGLAATNVQTAIDEIVAEGPGGTSATEVDFRDYGAIADNGGTNNTPAFNAMIADMKARGINQAYIPTGSYYFYEKPNTITFGLQLRGDGMNQTVLRRNYNEAGTTTGLLHFMPSAVGGVLKSTVNGAKVSNLAILAVTGTSGGAAIGFASIAESAANYVELEGLYLSAMDGGSWYCTLAFNGSNRIAGPEGVRNVKISGCDIFGASYCSLYGNAIKGLTIVGSSLQQAGGTGTYTGGMVITGTPTNQSYYLSAKLTTLGPSLFTECHYGDINATVFTGNIQFTSAAFDIALQGALSGGTISNGGTRCGIRKPGANWSPT